MLVLERGKTYCTNKFLVCLSCCSLCATTPIDLQDASSQAPPQAISSLHKPQARQLRYNRRIYWKMGKKSRRSNKNVTKGIPQNKGKKPVLVVAMPITLFDTVSDLFIANNRDEISKVEPQYRHLNTQRSSFWNMHVFFMLLAPLLSTSTSRKSAKTIVWTAWSFIWREPMRSSKHRHMTAWGALVKWIFLSATHGTIVLWKK